MDYRPGWDDANKVPKGTDLYARSNPYLMEVHYYQVPQDDGTIQERIRGKLGSSSFDTLYSSGFLADIMQNYLVAAAGDNAADRYGEWKHGYCVYSTAPTGSEELTPREERTYQLRKFNIPSVTLQKEDAQGSLTATSSFTAPKNGEKIRITPTFELLPGGSSDGVVFEVDIYDSAGNAVLQKKSDDPACFSWDGTDSTGTAVAEGQYTFTIFAYLPVGTWAEYAYTAPTQQGTLSINNAEADPEEFDPTAEDPDNYSKISGQIVAENGEATSIEWQVTIEDSNQSVVKTFDSCNGNPGNGPWNVSETWYGKKDDGTNVDAGEYTFKIKATANMSGQTCEASAEGIINITTGPVLEVYDEDENLVASSEDKYPTLSSSLPVWPDEDVFATLKRKSFAVSREFELGKKNYIIPRKHSDSPTEFTVVLTNCPSDGDVDITWESLTFKNSTITTLKKVSDVPHIHKGKFPLDKLALSKNSFSWFDSTYYGTGLSDSYAFIQNEQNRGYSDYLGGVFNISDIISSEDEQLFFVQPTKEALRRGGFETFLGKYTDPKTKEKKVSLHIQNQARDFFYSGHGFHDEGKIWIKEKEWMTADSFSVDDWSDNIGTAIFIACSIFDIGDFNRMYSQSTASHTANPGRKWFTKLVKNNSNDLCLLGYNFSAPPSPYDVYAVNAYFSYLKSTDSSNHGCALAWLKSNAKTSDYDTACAITKDYYYFIRFDQQSQTSTTLHANRPHWWHVRRTAYKIARKVWADSNPPEFSKIDDAYKIPIEKYEPVYSIIGVH